MLSEILKLSAGELWIGGQMPIVMRWYNQDHTILYADYQGNITMRDVKNAVKQAFVWTTNERHWVHVIVDLGRVRILPRNTLAAMQYTNKRIAENQGIIVYVQPTTFIQSIIGLAKVTGTRSVRNLYIANSIAEAEKIISDTAVVP